MESGKEKVTPTASTYAMMLTFWYRFNPETSANPVATSEAQSPQELLLNIMDHNIPVTQIVADRCYESSEEASEIILLLSKAAVTLNLSKVLMELGQAEAMGSQAFDPLSDVPEVMPVRKADAKVASDEEIDAVTPAEVIPFNLDNLRRHLADVTLARRVLPEDVAARQKLLEESVYDVAVERLKHQADMFAELGLGSGSLRQPDLQKWMWSWHLKLKDRLEKEIRNIAHTESTKRQAANREHQLLSPYLSLVKAERLSLLTILEVMRLHGAGGIADGMKTTRALIAVGKAVEIEYKAQMCRQNNIPIPASSRMGENFFSNMGYRNLQERRVAAAKHMIDGEAWTASWSQSVRSKVGGILVECLMDVATVERTAIDKRTKETVSETQPAFVHSYEYLRGQKLGVIRLNPVVAERLAKDSVGETLHPRHLPMLVKPKPWVNYDQGGYLYNKSFAMRFKDSVEQQLYLKQASELGNVELVYAGLDVLGSTPWKVNKKLFDVVLKVWNSGERMGKIPPVSYDRSEPQIPENIATDMKAKSIYAQRQRSFIQGKANNHSDRCSVNYKIEIARAFLGDTIYLPHNLDFRGRAYPIPPHLNHIGDDLCRGLLVFDESKPLGERGLRWLKIHLANLYGFDKASFDERVAWVMERIDDIYDSATNPLDGRRWWTQAGDPWQCLSTCMELHAALESGDPHSYMSCLPVHQDGTCNGLQHYAALGGDARGAQQVNLAAADRPSDVYSHVGNMVEQMIDKDAERGEKWAILLKGKITRKVVKQTVMTTVYGVTFVGARDQIERQLKDRKDIAEEDCWPAASYLAKLVLACIGDLFSGAKSIQTWLNLCARLISKSIPEERLPEAMADEVISRNKGPVRGAKRKSIPMHRLKKEQMTSVIWTTPLGLPIVQPYRKNARKQVMTTLQTVFISDPNSPAEVNSMKQASAFPPNFIHSLDATHMMLTALECRNQNLTFASVHDSYWTHASSIDKMSEIIRDTFIALHSSDVLTKLQEEFLERYKGYKVPLVNLSTGQFTKSLRAAGSRIVVTPEQAKTLSTITDLLEISETEQPTIEQTDVAKSPDELEELLKDIEAEPANEAEETKEMLDELISEESEEEEEYISPQMRNARARKAEEERAKLELMGKFVNLTDIFPPLPAKGNFKVEDIKSSQYFFS
ncbi:hypothetical protein BDQ12DRAFT_607612 [Crucibulum laeve]|uniref:DNA-directed RNA polymerase n=1 Tax=Crucibulum laeve TaxID=68775 RepID=A0A5C3LWQ8_9AGAR|nr:hypothetical protein BDQ12DRAFT_607612 [Crucibulum laeve]